MGQGSEVISLKLINDRSKELFYVDIEGQEFKNGVRLNHWGMVYPNGIDWPKFCFWVKAEKRDNSPDKFYILADLTGYPSFPPAGALWDLENNDYLPKEKFPKMKPGSPCERIFSIRWRKPEPNNKMGFYCHFDQEALRRHPVWVKKYPDQAWTREHTIADYLNFFYKLLSGKDYVGIG